MRRLASGRRRSIAEALASGMVGGLAGTVAMTQFQNAWRMSSRRCTEQSTHFPVSEPSDIEACARIVSRLASFSGSELPAKRISQIALLMHYAVGMGAGALYGLMREITSRRLPAMSSAIVTGAGFGSAMYFAAERFVTPTLGFEERGSLMGTPAYGLSSHVVYGIVSAAVCDRTRLLLSQTH